MKLTDPPDATVSTSRSASAAIVSGLERSGTIRTGDVGSDTRPQAIMEYLVRGLRLAYPAVSCARCSTWLLAATLALLVNVPAAAAQSSLAVRLGARPGRRRRQHHRGLRRPAHGRRHGRVRRALPRGRLGRRHVRQLGRPRRRADTPGGQGPRQRQRGGQPSDVATALGNPFFAASGFDAVVPGNALSGAGQRR